MEEGQDITLSSIDDNSYCNKKFDKVKMEFISSNNKKTEMKLKDIYDFQINKNKFLNNNKRHKSSMKYTPKSENTILRK